MHRQSALFEGGTVHPEVEFRSMHISEAVTECAAGKADDAACSPSDLARSVRTTALPMATKAVHRHSIHALHVKVELSHRRTNAVQANHVQSTSYISSLTPTERDHPTDQNRMLERGSKGTKEDMSDLGQDENNTHLSDEYRGCWNGISGMMLAASAKPLEAPLSL